MLFVLRRLTALPKAPLYVKTPFVVGFVNKVGYSL